jgi:hypothetical protein
MQCNAIDECALRWGSGPRTASESNDDITASLGELDVPTDDTAHTHTTPPTATGWAVV